MICTARVAEVWQDIRQEVVISPGMTYVGGYETALA
jgi:hypothetical protein